MRGYRSSEAEDHRMEVAAWLRGLGLEQYAPAFRENDVDSEVLPQLTADDLISIGVASVGHRRKMLAAIASLGAAAPAAAATVAPRETPAPADAERRQLTVMFCDLVGSTALSVRLTPRNCARRSAPTRTPFPASSRAMTALSPNTWATGCWSISAIRGHMRTTPSGRYG